MKILLFSISMFCFTSAVSQTPYYDFKKYHDQKKPLHLLKNDLVKELSINQLLDLKYSYSYIKPQATLLLKLENGNKIYSLPLDNMVCLVPEMSQFNMPNLSKGKKVNRMPPGIMPPYKIIPETLR